MWLSIAAVFFLWEISFIKNIFHLFSACFESCCSPKAKKPFGVIIFIYREIRQGGFPCKTTWQGCTSSRIRMCTVDFGLT